jgi:hypothetical protein
MKRVQNNGGEPMKLENILKKHVHCTCSEHHLARQNEAASEVSFRQHDRQIVIDEDTYTIVQT